MVEKAVVGEVVEEKENHEEMIDTKENARDTDQEVHATGAVAAAVGSDTVAALHLHIEDDPHHHTQAEDPDLDEKNNFLMQF